MENENENDCACGINCMAAATRGDLVSLKMAAAHNCPRLRCRWLGHYAAAGGRLETLQWLLARDQCYWNERICWEAAARGHLEVLQWSVGAGCPWDPFLCKAVAGNRSEIVAWIDWALTEDVKEPEGE